MKYCICVVGLLGATYAFAQGLPSAPELSWRGVVVNSPGTTSLDVKVRLWRSKTGMQSTDQLCSAAPFVTVPVDASGRFEVELDAACIQAIRANGDLWVDLESRTQGVLGPRSVLKAVPFALRSERLAGSWQNVPLQSGWQGNTKCRRLGDTIIVSLYAYNTAVVFSGAATQVVATLPAECRPSTSAPDAVGSVSVGPGGGVPGSWAGFAFLLSATGQVVVTCSNVGDAAAFCGASNQKSVTGTLILPAD